MVIKILKKKWNKKEIKVLMLNKKVQQNMN